MLSPNYLCCGVHVQVRGQLGCAVGMLIAVVVDCHVEDCLSSITVKFTTAHPSLPTANVRAGVRQSRWFT